MCYIKNNKCYVQNADKSDLDDKEFQENRMAFLKNLKKMKTKYLSLKNSQVNRKTVIYVEKNEGKLHLLLILLQSAKEGKILAAKNLLVGYCTAVLTMNVLIIGI